MKATFVFRLKHDIQNDSEIRLAEYEIQGLFSGKVTAVRNLVDLFSVSPFVDLLSGEEGHVEGVRIQDVLFRLPYPGKLHAFVASGELLDCYPLFARLAYFRDVVLLVKDAAPATLLCGLFPSLWKHGSDTAASFLEKHPWVQVFNHRSVIAVRFVPLHVFLEVTEHIGRLATKAADVDRMVAKAIEHLRCGFQRPYVPSVNVGFKWIEDFIDDRRAPMAYSTHAFFGLRGKFFPRMIRALLNGMSVSANHGVLDPFCGVGTLGVEAALMGLPSLNCDVNPLFIHVGRVKCAAISMDIRQLERDITDHLNAVQESGFGDRARMADVSDGELLSRFPRNLHRFMNADAVRLIRAILSDARSRGNTFAAVASVPIAYAAKSFVQRYSLAKILRSYWGHLWRMYYILYAQQLIRSRVFEFPIGRAEFCVADTRKLVKPGLGHIDCVVSSPPYATAVDYVGNDLYSLYLLELVTNHRDIDGATIGSPRAVPSLGMGWYPSEKLPTATRVLAALQQWGSPKATPLQSYFEGMIQSFQQLRKCLAREGRACIIIGREQVYANGSAKVYLDLASAIAEVAALVGITVEDRWDIALAKNTEGAFDTESILMLRNPPGG